jgi:hypothetical protein
LFHGLRVSATANGTTPKSVNDDGRLHELYQRCRQEAKTLMASGFMNRKVESGSWTAFLFRFDRTNAMRDLSWALQYWLSEREPIPEKRNRRKCAACPLNAVRLCDHALQAPDSDTEVQRHPDGHMSVRP